jgi:hypothetical protein
MSVHNMKFVLVRRDAARDSVYSACSRPPTQGYPHDLASSRRYCGSRATPDGW